MKKITSFLFAFVLTGTTFSQNALMGSWDLTAGSLTDGSGNGYTGSLVGTPTTDYDRFGNNASSYYCPTGGDRITTACPGVSGTGNRTISFWAKTSQSGGTVGCLNYGGGPLGGDFNVYLETTPGFEAISVDVSDEVDGHGTTVADGKWHQYVISYNSAWGYSLYWAKFYRDGVLLNNLANLYNPGGHVLNTYTNTTVSFGGGNMNIDDVKIFGTALSGTQVDSLFVAEAPLNTCLFAKYDFTGNANDTQGTNHCSVNGATLSADRYGNPNSAYSFNGASDFLSTTSAVNLVGQSFSIGCWAKRTTFDAFWHAMFSQGITSTDQGLHLGLTGTPGPQNVAFEFYNDGIYLPNGYADTSTWVQWYFNYDYGTGTANVYANGTLVLSQLMAGPYTGSGNLYIGGAAWGGNNFEGLLDDIKMFNCCLSASQMDSLYQSEKVPPCQLSVAVTGVTNTSCFGAADGALSTTVTDAVGSVSYLWSPNSETTAGLSFVPAGSYTVTVTDGIGCTASQTGTVNEPGQLFVNYMGGTQPFCPGSCDGGAFYFTSGGNGGETWDWQPGSFTNVGNINSLCAGTYTVTVTDINGCVGSDIFTLVDPPPLLANVTTVMPVSCNGMCDAIIAAAPTGGTPGGGAKIIMQPGVNGPGGYNITWNPGSIQIDSLTGLCAGTYTVTVSDFNSCTVIDSVTLINPAPFSVAAGSVSPTCPGYTDGKAYADGIGGTLPYTFNWSNAMSGDTLFGMDTISNLIVNAIDNNGCAASDTVNVMPSNPFFLTLTVNSSSCGAPTGSISSVTTGGTAPYSYLWNTGDPTTSIASVPSGQYFLQVYDANGCYASELGIVNDIGGATIALNTVTNVTCAGADDGAVDVTVSGGTAPYDMLWSTGQTTEDISGLAGSSYDLVVTDAVGCITSFIANVMEPAPISIAANYVASGCGFSNGRADAIVSGGTAPYSFMWDAATGNQTTPNAFNVPSGAYKVIVTDFNSCVDSAYIAVADTSGPVVDIDSTKDAGCVLNGGAGEIWINVAGAGPFTYQWNNGAITEDVNSLGIGIFGVVVTDTNGCKGGAAAYIHGLRPGAAKLCLTTVDTSNMHNLIIWNDTVVGVALYEIFRETSVPNQYNLIASIPAGSAGFFEDTIADADNHPWRYRIRATDSCGIESYYSLSHKPIHLVVANGSAGSADLSWDHYQGASYNQYYILRYHFTTGWVVIDSLPYGSATVYNDPSPIAPLDSNRYFIEVDANVACGESRALVNTSRSNIKNLAADPTMSLANTEENVFSVFPNPSKNEFNIKFGVQGRYVLKVYDARGRLVSQENTFANAGGIVQIKGADWAQGVYFLQVLFPDGKTKNVKLVKQ